MTNDVVQGPMEGFTAFELRKARAEIERLEGIQRDFHNLDDLATIEQLHAAVKTAQELAATRLMEIERLKAENLSLRNAAVNLHEQLHPNANAHEPGGSLAIVCDIEITPEEREMMKPGQLEFVPAPEEQPRITERDYTDAAMHAGLPPPTERDIQAMNAVIDALYANRKKSGPST